MNFDLSSEKLGYVEAVLRGGNRMRWCVAMCVILSVVLFLTKSISSGLEMLLVGVLGTLMMRSIVDGVYLGGTLSASDPRKCLSFVLPLTLVCVFGVVFDACEFAYNLLHGEYSLVNILLMCITCSVRIVMLQRLIPIARMIVDPTFIPLSMQTANDALLIRSENMQFHLPTPMVLTSGTFRPFTTGEQQE